MRAEMTTIGAAPKHSLSNERKRRHIQRGLFPLCRVKLFLFLSPSIAGVMEGKTTSPVCRGSLFLTEFGRQRESQDQDLTGQLAVAL